MLVLSPRTDGKKLDSPRGCRRSSGWIGKKKRPDFDVNSVQMFSKSLSALATATILWTFFFAVFVGLGYPTLNRYNPGILNPDASEYSKMVRSEEGVAPHFLHRVLIPYLARPIFRAAVGRVGSWNPAYFALLLVNSWFVSGTAFLLFMVVSRNIGSPTIAMAGRVFAELSNSRRR